ncbi:hypothetical protein MUK42_25177 [Musa troglodytarum]|uniref:Uncharacterized protein n=1 Tax=Musa troglodytarum TaxID=320322 RepID=A0A9E7KK07_9LILI|nr:hypothetical protein MUK42_25177 [Musa troglodytarum]URE20227.1 hypothetical protein MUK42_25177 [Musa troglodytarum]
MPEGRRSTDLMFGSDGASRYDQDAHTSMDLTARIPAVCSVRSLCRFICCCFAYCPLCFCSLIKLGFTVVIAGCL